MDSVMQVIKDLPDPKQVVIEEIGNVEGGMQKWNLSFIILANSFSY